jgi:hypothetical protein
MVPLDEIKTKVMMAMRISGICTPPISRANTSEGFGQASDVDMRAVM